MLDCSRQVRVGTCQSAWQPPPRAGPAGCSPGKAAFRAGEKCILYRRLARVFQVTIKACFVGDNASKCNKQNIMNDCSTSYSR